MAAYLLDTDVLSLLQRAHPQVSANVARRTAELIGTTAVTIEEQMGGWLTLARTATTPQRHEDVSQFLVRLVASWARFPVFPVTVAALARFDQLVQMRLNVGRNDLRIAAVALELGATVVTRNRRDFGRVPGLPVEDWSA